MDIFKAYDVRGRYPDEINEKVVADIAKGLAEHFNREPRTSNSEQQRVVVIGHDARSSSPALYEVVRESLVRSSKSLVIMPAGMITTPMLYFLVNRYRAAGGIMVTASHNPPEYNGIKAVGPRAVPISGTEIRLLTEAR